MKGHSQLEQETMSALEAGIVEWVSFASCGSIIGDHVCFVIVNAGGANHSSFYTRCQLAKPFRYPSQKLGPATIMAFLSKSEVFS